MELLRSPLAACQGTVFVKTMVWHEELRATPGGESSLAACGPKAVAQKNVLRVARQTFPTTE